MEKNYNFQISCPSVWMRFNASPLNDIDEQPSHSLTRYVGIVTYALNPLIQINHSVSQRKEIESGILRTCRSRRSTKREERKLARNRNAWNTLRLAIQLNLKPPRNAGDVIIGQWESPLQIELIMWEGRVIATPAIFFHFHSELMHSNRCAQIENTSVLVNHIWLWNIHPNQTDRIRPDQTRQPERFVPFRFAGAGAA